MKTLVVLVVALVGLAAGVSLYDLAKDEWDEFKSHHGKSYENEVEERFRMKIYLENRQRIARHTRMLLSSLL
jgi:cathepsin L